MTPSLPPLTPGRIEGLELRDLIGAEARVILEIGAHHGEHTAGFLKLFPKATIHAFEPDLRALAKFKANISSPRARLYETAIGARDGQAVFHVSGGMPPGAGQAKALMTQRYPQGWDQSGSLRAPKAHKEKWPWCRFDATAAVPVRSLDTWAREHGVGDVDFIWADMQGAEGDLIEGGRATLARTRYLYTEYSNEELYEGEPTLPMILDMLPDFSVVKLYPEDMLLKNNSI